MEGTQYQYRLQSIKSSKPLRTEKRTTTTFTSSKKPKGKYLDSQPPSKGQLIYTKKTSQKQKEVSKHQKYSPKTEYYPVNHESERQRQGAYLSGYQYYPQYVMPGIIGYPEMLVPVYGYPVHYMESPYNGKQATEENSPQGLGNSGCPTVASEEDLKNRSVEECEFKVVCNGSVVHKKYYGEQETDAVAESAISLSDYEEFVLPFTENEPKSDAIPLPSFLA